MQNVTIVPVLVFGGRRICLGHPRRYQTRAIEGGHGSTLMSGCRHRLRMHATTEEEEARLGVRDRGSVAAAGSSTEP